MHRKSCFESRHFSHMYRSLNGTRQTVSASIFQTWIRYICIEEKEKVTEIYFDLVYGSNYYMNGALMEPFNKE